MFWRLFVKEPPVESALEGIVFKEGRGRFIKRFWKKRLLVYDEVGKCLHYYTPQRSLKDILFITPGRSYGIDLKKDDVFEITIPGRVYVFHVNNIRDTRKWIGILSRELDSLKIRDRIMLNNGNYSEATYSKTLMPNSVLLNSLKIGEHREHEECCFLFDEEHQHKIIALESLCSLQAMKIFELSHSVERSQKRNSELEAPPSKEMEFLRDENRRLRFSFEREKIRVLDLQATVEEHEEKKQKTELDKQLIKKVEKHNHFDFKVVQVERGESSTNPNPQNSRKLINQTNKGNIEYGSNVNLLMNSDKSKMEEVKRLTEELARTKALLAQEKQKALDNTNQPPNFNSPSPSVSPIFFSTFNTTTTTTTTTSSASSSPDRSPIIPSRSATTKLPVIPETTAINAKQNSLSTYNTFSPATLTNAYLNHHIVPSVPPRFVLMVLVSASIVLFH